MNGGEPAAAPGAGEQKRLGGFELLGRLGEGNVYKAREAATGRLVALRLLPKALTEKRAFVQRFLRESLALAALRHPHIVPAHAGFVEDQYYLAAELVGGATLGALLQRSGPLDPRRAVEFLRQVGSALAAAHREGILHRGITPASILVDEAGRARVCDFGLASRSDDDMVVTAHGPVLGDPTYLAPEVMAGAEADARSDLYSLGATFFHVVAGRPPFEGRGIAGILASQTAGPAPRLASVVQGADPRLCHVIDRLLRGNPEARYSSAEALLDELSGVGELPVATVVSEEPEGAAEAERPVRPAAGPRLRPRGAAAPPAREPRRGKSRAALVAGLAILALASVTGAVLAIRGCRTESAPPMPPEPPAKKKAQAERKVRTGVPPGPQTPLEAEMANLRGECGELMARDRFKEAVERAAALKQRHASGQGAEEAAELHRWVLGRARRRWDELVRAADAAMAQKDWAKARAELDRVSSLGVPDLDEARKKKLAEIGEAEKAAEQQAKFEAARATALEAAAKGEFAKAAEMLDPARWPGVDTKAIEDALAPIRQACDKAYRAEAEQVWGLFRRRKYDEAGKKLGELVARMGKALPAEAAEAEAEALKLLRLFWVAVERGFRDRVGKTIKLGDAEGKLVAVQDGRIVLGLGAKMESAFRIVELAAGQVAKYALFAGGEPGSLAKGVFLLAEGVDYAAAEQLLKDAGDTPIIRRYKQRLDAVKDAAQDAAARERWAGITALAKGSLNRQAAETLRVDLDAFEKQFATAGFYHTVKADVGALRVRVEDALAEWTEMFDGKTLRAWTPVTRFPLQDAKNPGATGIGGAASVENGQITLATGGPATGIAWRERFPNINYEVSLEAERLTGTNAVCMIVFPVGGSHCLMWVGAGKPSIVGLDFLNGEGCRRNPSGFLKDFESHKSYRVRLRVTQQRIEGWVDDDKLFDVAVQDTKFTVERPYEQLTPFGLGSYETTVALRSIRYRRVETPAGGEVKRRAGDLRGGRPADLLADEARAAWRVQAELPGIGKATAPQVGKDGIAFERTGQWAAVAWTGDSLEDNYDLAFEVRLTEGTGDFCHVLFPVGRHRGTLTLSAGPGQEWPGPIRLTGLAEGQSRYYRPLTPFFPVESGRWHRVRLRVTQGQIQGWFNDTRTVDLGKQTSPLLPRPEFANLKPFGIAAAGGASFTVRNISLRKADN